MKKVVIVALTVASISGYAVTVGVLPSSKYQYAEDCEYESLLALPWVSRNVKKPAVEFSCPKCVEPQSVAKMYEDTMLFNGVVKLAAENVVVGMTLQTIPCGDNEEFAMIRKATNDELQSKAFFKKFDSLIGRNDVARALSLQEISLPLLLHVVSRFCLRSSRCEAL